MLVLRNISQLNTFRAQVPNDSPIGLVPTMGALHQGHISIINTSLKECKTTVVSIFVNPLQFNNKDDLENYPTTIEKDLDILKNLGVNAVFLPSHEEINTDTSTFSVTCSSNYNKILEATFRPGHFPAVLTIVTKLINLVRPTRCYLGKKDYQQLKLVQEMVKAFHIQTEVIACPTIRNNFGLPLSSRNTRLAKNEINLLEKIYRKLATTSLSNKDTIASEITQSVLKLDYFEYLDDRFFIAFHIGAVRIIDNFTKEELHACINA